MKALCWHGQGDVRIDTVPDAQISEPTDAVIKVTATAICGSDLHLFDGYMSAMREGDVLGHEPMGEVVAVGPAVKNLAVGDRVVVPFTISCGACYFCEKQLYSLCDESNPNAQKAAEELGHSPAGIFGYSHMLGGFPGGQAEYLRVPYADVGPIKIESNLPDEKVLFLSDIFPTGYMGAENAQIEEGDSVAVWGCGPVGLFAIQSAWMLGAGRVFAVDREPERLEMARTIGKAETIDFSKEDVYDRLMSATTGRGPDRCIDAVGAEAHAGNMAAAAVDSVKSSVGLQKSRPYVLQEAIKCCRKGGTISMPGVYTTPVDSLPVHAFMNKSLTLKTGQTHVQRYLRPLLGKIESGEIDPSAIITHTAPLEQAPQMYETFRDKEDGCVKVVLKP